MSSDPTPGDGAPTPKASQLPDHLAFVVRFVAGTASPDGSLAGRVEHVISGRGGRFESLEGLLGVVRGLLAVESRDREEE